nr:hypothetical protein [Tanacetum cinerariifolium]
KQIYEPTSVEEKLDRKNDMKAKGTLLMALPNKDQLKFHSYKDYKLLMEAIEKRYGGNKESKKDHQTQAKIHKMWPLYHPTAQTTQAAQIKQITLLMQDDLEQIDPNDLEEMDLHWEMAMLTIRARRECKAPKNQENKGREYGRKVMPVENLTKNALIAQDEIRGYEWSYQAEEEHPTNYALMALTSTKSSFSSDSEENVKSRSDKGYHAIPPPYAGNYIPPKHDQMFIDEQVKSEYVDVVSNVASSVVKTVEPKHKFINVKNKGVYSTIETKPVSKNNFSLPIIKDWISDDESEVEFKPKVEVKTVRPSI